MADKSIVLLYDADGGFVPMLADVVKKTFGFEECPLCEIVYSPVGKRGAWKQCEAKLPYPVEHKHRNEVPPAWLQAAGELPVVALREGNRLTVLLDRAALGACKADPVCLDAKIRAALSS